MESNCEGNSFDRNHPDHPGAKWSHGTVPTSTSTYGLQELLQTLDSVLPWSDVHQENPHISMPIHLVKTSKKPQIFDAQNYHRFFASWGSVAASDCGCQKDYIDMDRTGKKFCLCFRLLWVVVEIRVQEIDCWTPVSPKVWKEGLKVGMANPPNRPRSSGNIMILVVIVISEGFSHQLYVIYRSFARKKGTI